MTTLLLSVSIGEALDKLSILQIKYENIENADKNHEVFNELSKILPLLTNYCTKLFTKVYLITSILSNFI